MRLVPAIICLGAGRGQLPFIEAARKKHKVIAIDRNQEAPGFALSTERVVKSTYDAVGIIRALDKFQKQYRIVGLIARTSGFALRTAARIAKRFKLIGPSPAIIPLATEKSRLQMFCRRHGLRMPGNMKVKHCSDRVTALRFPLIIKPDFPLIGKKAINVVYDKAQLAAAFSAAAEASGNHFVEVEEYIEGFDVSCLFTLRRGRVHIIDFWDELVGVRADGSIKGLGVSMPSVIKKTTVEKSLIALVRRFGTLFPRESALLILSFRINEAGEPYIIELHADLGGDLIADVLLPKANTQFDFFRMAVDFAVQGKVKQQAWRFRPTTLIYDQPKNKVFQRGSIVANLRAAERLNAKQKLTQQSLHLNWLKKCSR